MNNLCTRWPLPHVSRFPNIYLLHQILCCCLLAIIYKKMYEIQGDKFVYRGGRWNSGSAGGIYKTSLGSEVDEQGKGARIQVGHF